MFTDNEKTATIFISKREKQVGDLLMIGLKNREIAEKIGLSISTVKHYISSLYQKVGATSRVEAILKMQKNPPQLASDAADAEAAKPQSLRITNKSTPIDSPANTDTSMQEVSPVHGVKETME